MKIAHLAIALLLAAVWPAWGQSALSEGRTLTAALQLDPKADVAMMAAVGYDRAQILLMEVLTQGQSPSASAADWTNLHRATEGLIELYVAKGEILKASVFASIQDGFYRNLDHNYPEALRAARFALQLHRDSMSSSNLSVTLGAVGRDLRASGAPAEAIGYIEEALNKADMPTSKSTGALWRDLVQAQLESGNLTLARAEADRFLAASRNDRQPLRPMAFLANSDVLVAEKEYGRAIDALRLARQAGADMLELTSQLLSCVLLSMRSLHYAEALRLAQRVELEFPDLPVSATTFARQAIQVRRLMAGAIDEVLREQVAELADARAAHRRAAQIDILLRMAATYHAANSLKDQITALEQALDLDRGLGTLNLLADAHLAAGEPGMAHQLFEEVIRRIDSIAEAGERSKLEWLFGEAMLGRAQVAQAEDDPEEARNILAQALAGSIKFAKFSREDILWQAARLERSEGAVVAANRYYEQAIEVVQVGRKMRVEVVIRLEYAHFLAVNPSSYRESGSEALRQVAQARRLAAILNMAECLWRLDYETGIVAELRGDRAAASRDYQAAISRLESIQNGLTAVEHRRSLIDTDPVQDLYRRALGLAGDTAKRWDLAERAKAQIFLAQLQGKRFRGSETVHPAVRSIRQLEDRIATLQMETSGANADLLRASGREPVAARQELHRLESRFAFESQQSILTESRAGQSRTAHPVALSRIQRLLPRNAAVIEFGAVNDGLLVFVITRNQLIKARCQITPGTLRLTVNRLRVLLADPQSGPELAGVIERLSSQIWAPVAAVLPKPVGRLLIVPAGVLSYIPFQLLQSNGRMLVDSFTVSYLPSASVLALLTTQPAALDNVFLGAIGNATADGTAPLPGTLQEVAGIAQMLPKAVQRLGEGFTHDEARGALLRYEVVHFATHGLNEAAPMFSALLTARASGQPARLSLYELADLPMKAKLVVLSACETGLGKLSGGDEVSGLTRTLILAGANTVVSSLWKVSDDSTAHLMRAFYDHLRRGDRPALAMREASLEVRRHFSHPFYWAPFVVTGAD